MPAQRRWGIDPERGGIPIPDPVKVRVEQRIRRYAERHFAGSYTRLELRFRGQFCYIDAYTEQSEPGPGWPPPGSGETRDELMERLRTTPTYLCRLRYFGDDERWGFAFYTYSHGRYEFSILPSGDFLEPPEEAFDVSAQVYLQETGATASWQTLS